MDTHYAQVVGLCLLLTLLVFIAQKLAKIRALLLPESTHPKDFVRAMSRKAALFAFGSYFLLLSTDKVSSKDLKRARNADECRPHGAINERQIRIIFVRHGESVWNYVFNRGFGLSFLMRLLRVTLYELCVLQRRICSRMTIRPIWTRRSPISASSSVRRCRPFCVSRASTRRLALTSQR